MVGEFFFLLKSLFDFNLKSKSDLTKKNSIEIDIMNLAPN